MLEVTKICKSFTNSRSDQGVSRVLQDITFTADKGEFITVLGPSGCGKTTLIKIISRLIAPDSGQVLINQNREYKPGKDVCMVFQNYGLLPWLTVIENAAFGLKLRGFGSAERNEKAHHYVKLVGLKGFEHYYPHQISGGMQQRVGLARALANEPPVLVMDEPFGSVDAQTRELLQKELLRIWNETKNTIVFVTHSIEEAIYLGDRVLVMSPGRIIQISPVDLPRPRYAMDIGSNVNFQKLASDFRALLTDRYETERRVDI